MVTPCTPFPNVLLKRRTCDAFFSLFFKISKKSNIKNRIFDCWLSDVSKTSMLRAQKKKKKTMLHASAWFRPRAGRFARRSFWDPESWVKRKGVLRAAEWITIRFGLRFFPLFYLRTPYFKVLSVRSLNKPLFSENLGINAILFRFFFFFDFYSFLLVQVCACRVFVSLFFNGFVLMNSATSRRSGRRGTHCENDIVLFFPLILDV